MGSIVISQQEGIVSSPRVVCALFVWIFYALRVNVGLHWMLRFPPAFQKYADRLRLLGFINFCYVFLHSGFSFAFNRSLYSEADIYTH